MSTTTKACHCGRVVPCPLHTISRSDRQASYGTAYRKERDRVVGTSLFCSICGLPPTDDDPFTGDHVVPVSAMAQPLPLQIRAAHASCNSRRGAAQVNGA